MEDEGTPLVNTDYASLYPHVIRKATDVVKMDATYYLNMIEGLLMVDSEARKITMSARYGKEAGEVVILIASHDRTVVREAMRYLGTEFSGEEPEDWNEVDFLRALVEKLKVKVKSEKFGL